MIFLDAPHIIAGLVIVAVGIVVVAVIAHSIRKY